MTEPSTEELLETVRQQLMKAEWPKGGHGTLAHSLEALSLLETRIEEMERLVKSLRESAKDLAAYAAQRDEAVNLLREHVEWHGPTGHEPFVTFLSHLRTTREAKTRDFLSRLEGTTDEH